jgi:hypothetical protein
MDKRTGRQMPPILTTEIYKGAVPFIGINVSVILLVIAFPYLITHYKVRPVATSPAAVQVGPSSDGGLGLPPIGGEAPVRDGGLGLPPLGMPPGGGATGNDGGLGLPPLGTLPSAPQGSAPGSAPALGSPPPGLGGDAPAPQPAPGAPQDLSQPPSFN